ncbi:hypothetical protein ACP70R_036329 [Stipagrostis hirtigluma subsp. patula]
MSVRSNTGAGDDQAALQGGMTLSPPPPPPPPPESQMVLVALEATRDQRDEDIRMALPSSNLNEGKATVPWCMSIYATIPLNGIYLSADLLEWHTRHAIALGIAKGLRYPHEECRGGPIIHGKLRASNVLLTHGFVPMLGGFGLAFAKWNAGKGFIQTRIILGQPGMLIMLISGRKALDDYEETYRPILQWAEPLVESLALNELVDDRIKDTYDPYGLYHLVRAAYLCVRPSPEQRPSIGEIVRLIDPENEHIRDLSREFIPHFTK